MNNRLKKKFSKQLQQGNLGEKVIAHLLKKKFYMTVIEFCNTGDYDIKMNFNNKLIHFEVKTDRWERFKRQTGNMFIETRCNGKPSGIWKTKAEFFVYYYPDLGEIYMIKTSELKELLKKPEVCQYKPGSGDDKRVSGFLISRWKWKKLFKVFYIPKIDLSSL